jgi:5-methyltetrahydropteroyltriglutamate--homocysteine methyltransferase
VKRTTPPYRADHVGSFLRTAPIKQAREKHEKGQISGAELKTVEDGEIEKLIKKQEEVGLQLATDGEFRRSWWHFDFYGMLDGVEIYELDHGIQFQGVQTKPRSIRVKGKLGFSNHPMLEHFKFVKAHTKVTPKMCIPSPTVMHFRLEPGAVVNNAYPDRDAIFFRNRSAAKTATSLPAILIASVVRNSSTGVTLPGNVWSSPRRCISR